MAIFDKASLDEATIAELAESFCRAEEEVAPRSLITDLYADLSLNDAYAIQFAAIENKLAAGHRLLGYKVGFASRTIQEAFGVHEPMFGHLLDGAISSGGASVSRQRYIHPGVEPELAFFMGQSLRGPGVNAEQVVTATKTVQPAFELVDIRFPSWKFKAADSIADNGFNAGAVLSGEEASVAGRDLRTIEMVMEKNEEVVGSGQGSAVFGNPANSVAWLVNKLAEFGRALEAGQYVLCGSFTTTYAAEAGDRFRARYAGLGSVSVEFN